MFRTLDPNYKIVELFKVEFHHYYTRQKAENPNHVSKKVTRECFKHFEDYKAFLAWRTETNKMLMPNMGDRKLKMVAVNDLNRILKKHPELEGMLHVITFSYL